MFLNQGLLRGPGGPCTVLTAPGTWSTFPQGATDLVRGWEENYQPCTPWPASGNQIMSIVLDTPIPTR